MTTQDSTFRPATEQPPLTTPTAQPDREPVDRAALQPGRVPAREAGPERVDTVIVGAGQAGLATAYHLKQAGIAAVVLDGRERVGDVWRERYDSLRLFTPAQYDGLPGMDFPLPRHSWPSGHQVADFLQSYAETMGIAVRTSTPVERVTRTDAGQYLVTCGTGSILARNVVIATGGQHTPHVPEFAGQLDPGIRQIHSHDYRNPGQLLPGPTLVVGASTSGADLALEIAEAGHETWLSGRIPGEVPIDIEGRAARFVTPVLWFLANHVLTTRTPIGRRMQPEVRSHGGPLLRVKAEHLRAAGVHLNPARTTGVADEGRPLLADGTVLEVANVVWCTGFRPDYGIVDLPIVGDDGWPLDDGGVVPSAPGLFFVGLLFQRRFSSMLVGGAGRDARFIAEHVRARATVPAS